MTMTHRKVNSSKGFTIIELMIALSILSVILVIGSTLMARIGAQYTKGVNTANVNNTSRNIVSDVSSALQFSGDTVQSCVDDPVANPLTCHYSNPELSVTGKQQYNIDGINAAVYSFCIGKVRYTYVLNREMGVDQGDADLKTPHVLWRDTMANPNSCIPVDISNAAVDKNARNSVGDGYDVMPTHMRLTHFRIKQSPNATEQGVYTIAVKMAYGDSDLVVTDPTTGANGCKGGSGTAFCATSSINTTIIRRLKMDD